MNQERVYTVLVEPHFSEKVSVQGEQSNQYGFKVAKDATKAEIKEAVETIYEVPVKKVTVMNVKGKVKRNIRGVSKRPNWKKAYVSLEAGHDIDFS